VCLQAAREAVQTVFVQTHFPKPRQFHDDPYYSLKYLNVPTWKRLVKSLFENPEKALTSKCSKNDKKTHDCDCAL